ncbi:MAG: F0F1 ATP synthase subunit delta [Marinilabiliales bacterium]|nr:F0F1 ATP synthase subunit delta [Marinilabiliales bacterium]
MSRSHSTSINKKRARTISSGNSTEFHFFISETPRHNAGLLTTAVSASDKIRRDIIKMVSKYFGTEVALREVVNKDIIGGFILRVDDNLIDASVRKPVEKDQKSNYKLIDCQHAEIMNV